MLKIHLLCQNNLGNLRSFVYNLAFFNPVPRWLFSGDHHVTLYENNQRLFSSIWPEDSSVYRPTVRTDSPPTIKSSSSSPPKLMTVAAF